MHREKRKREGKSVKRETENSLHRKEKMERGKRRERERDTGKGEKKE